MKLESVLSFKCLIFTCLVLFMGQLGPCEFIFRQSNSNLDAYNSRIRIKFEIQKKTGIVPKFSILHVPLTMSKKHVSFFRTYECFCIVVRQSMSQITDYRGSNKICSF